MGLDKYWAEYADFYVHEPAYWYQPKGLAVKREQLPLIQRRLAALRRYEGDDWAKGQVGFTRDLEREGLVILRKPRGQYTGGDYSALARMNKVIFTNLGLAWVDAGQDVFITPFGRKFLGSPRRRLARLVGEQLYKYQMRNPSLPKMPESLRVFPHRFLLELLGWLPGGEITRAEYVLFVSRGLSDGDLAKVLDRVERYRRLDKDQKRELWQTLERTPIFDARRKRMRIGGRRSSLLNTINLDASYLLDLHAIPDYMSLGEADGQLALRIRPEDRAQVADLVGRHRHESWFVDYANVLDWISMYGDPEKKGTIPDAVEYYRTRLEVAKASEAQLAGRDRGILKEGVEPDAFTEDLVREKLLEVYLFDHLEELEQGLRAIGRQVSTPVGRLDILAQDLLKRWVVIELKRDRAPDKVAGQLQRYVGFIRMEKSAGRRQVRGMIVGRRIEKSLRQAISRNLTFRVDLYRHETSFHTRISPVALEP